MGIVFVIAGVFIGAAVGDDEGAVAGLAMGLLAAWLRRVSVRQAELDARLSTLEQAGARADRADVAVQPAGEDDSARTTARPAPLANAEADADAPPPVSVAAAPSDPWRSPAPAAGTRAAAADATAPAIAAARWFAPIEAAFRRLLRFFTTGNVVAKVGVVVLFFGVAFLARLAAERGMLPIELRLAAIVLGGIAMIGVGWRLRRRSRDYAIAIQGGGVGVLYLAIFAAARIYHLLPMSFAFALMVVLVAASAALAVLQNAQALAALGVSGGFLAPILTATGEGSHVALFSYYALLNAGILGIAWYRAWRVVNLLGFAFTYVIGSLWGARFYHPQYFGSVEPFLVLSFLFYLAIPVLYASRQAPRLRGLVDGSLVFGNPIVFFTLQSQLVRDIDYGRAYSALGMAIIYALLMRALWRRDPDNMRMLVETFLALAALFATLAIPFALDGHWTAAAWSLEGAGVVWVGLRQRRHLAQFAGLALQLGAALIFAIDVPFRFGPQPRVDTTVLGAAMIAAAALFTSYRLTRDGENAHRWLRHVELPMLAWGIAWWLGAMAYEIDARAAPRWFASVYVIALCASTLALAWVARRFDWSRARQVPLGMLPFAAALMLARFVDHPARAPWADGGWLAWPGVLAAGALLLARHATHWRALLVDATHAGLLYFAVFLLTWLLAACGAVSVAVLLGLSRPVVRGLAPIARHPRAYRNAGPAALVVLCGAWLTVSATYAGTPAPLAYVPALNPLDLVAAATLLAATAWWRGWVDAAGRRPIEPPLAMALLAAAGFIVLNTLVLRAMHHYTHVPYRAHSLWHSPDVQAALSLTWALLGSLTMAYAARRRPRRELWMVGAGLLGVVVAKLFVVDLAGSGAVARIVSFIGVGVVFLVIGYFAPLPPRRDAPEART